MSQTASERCWAILDKPGVELYHVQLTLRAWLDDDEYVAVCDDLGVASQGGSRGEAIDNVTEAAILYLNTIEQNGQRRRIFDERGISAERGLPAELVFQERRTLLHPDELVATVLVTRQETATAERV